jgi:glucose-1-phosphate cytidylyltransferase
MKVVILCGGLGTRLNEETEFKPKPLVQVGGMPILWHIMKIYSHYGHNEFILPLGYKGDMIKEFFIHFNWRANDFTLDMMSKHCAVHNNHKNEDWKIHFVDTGLETKTALRVKKIQHIIGDDKEFMLTYGDGVSDVDINRLIEFHRAQKRIATITGVKVSSKFGVLASNGNQLTDFNEKPEEANFINGGFMVFDSKVFKHFNDEDLMLEEKNGPLTKLAKLGEVSVYNHDGFWHSMDTYRDYLRLNQIWKESASWKIW